MAEIILGLMGGLGLFLYGMRLMSDSLEQAAGARMRAILEFFTDPITWDPCRYSFYSSDPVIQCLYSYGGQLCKLRADGSVPGRRRDHGS